MSIEAMKQALEALERIDEAMPFPVGKQAITSLRQAIAEAEKHEVSQEPVGEVYLCDHCQTPFDGDWQCPSCGHTTSTKEPVYTHPQPKAEQKPYGWAYESHGRFTCNAHPIFWKTRKAETHTEEFWEEIPLYRHPQPKREWVGLTGEEMKQVCYETFSYDPYVVARAIESKLKEKNT